MRDSLAINLSHCLTVVPLARLRMDVVRHPLFFAVWHALATPKLAILLINLRNPPRKTQDVREV